MTGEITPSNLRLLRNATGAPAVVINLVGSSLVSMATEQPHGEFFRTVASTVELLEWLRLESPQTAVVGISSAAVYGDGQGAALAETMPTHPMSNYGHHKLMTEMLYRSFGACFGLRSVIARPFSVYGPGLTKQMLWEACQRLHTCSDVLRLEGTGDEVRDWVHVDDAAEVLARLSTRAQVDAPIYNVGTGIGTSISQVAAALGRAWAEIAGTIPPRVEFSGRARVGDPFSLVADPRALHQIGLGCRRRLVDELPAYARWFLRHRGSSA
jgi:UDP-glucose 4-epimerase